MQDCAKGSKIERSLASLAINNNNKIHDPLNRIVQRNIPPRKSHKHGWRTYYGEHTIQPRDFTIDSIQVVKSGEKPELVVALPV
mmetsp:Transcript_7236/g.14961  ORF Transcript_7236/g.14961 Transcript_7236/m.14961 type:complete len:84 (-) Transcript_7236:95-346(-)